MTRAIMEYLTDYPLMSRVWSMPAKWTFEMSVARKVLERWDVGEGWVDPFAGMTIIPGVRGNDLNPLSPCYSHKPAHDFLKELVEEGCEVKGVVWDPPYSIHQVKESYDSYGLSVKDNLTGGFPKEKDLIATLLPPLGMVISFGWNSVGMGKGRGFLPIEYLLISHGGNRNDTIVVVEVKE